MADETQAALPKPTLQMSTAITSTDHGQIVALASWLCMAIGVLLSIARLYVRWPLNVLAGRDDIAYTIAILFAIAQTAITVNTVRKGFGKFESELHEWQVLNNLKGLYATDILFLFSLWSSKLSLSLLFGRLAKESRKMYLGQGLTTLCSVLGLSSILSVALRGDLTQPWVYRDGDISSILGRWIATGAMSIVMDLIIMVLSIYLVWGLQMDGKLKSFIITAFALRLFVAPVTIVRLVSIRDVQVDNLSFSYALPETMTQLEMYCHLIAATLPCLRIFLTAWNTSFMDIRLEEVDNNAYRKHTTSQSGARSKNSASKSQHSGLKSSSSRSPLWSPERGGRSEAMVGRAGRDSNNDASSENSEIAIIVKTTVDVSNDRRPRNLKL